MKYLPEDLKMGRPKKVVATDEEADPAQQQPVEAGDEEDKAVQGRWVGSLSP